MSPLFKCSGLLLILALQGCSLAPHYQVPQAELPAHYGERVGAWQMVGTEQILPA